MVSGAMTSGQDEAVELDHWSVRKIQPIVVLYIAMVFGAFMALSLFVFHSVEGVKALALGWIGAIVATIPGVVEKLDYRLTASGLEKRTLKTKNPGPFKDVFRWDELDHVIPTRHGFKYFKHLDEPNPLRRFWKAHISDEYSGEVHVEKGRLQGVLLIVEQRVASSSDSR